MRRATAANIEERSIIPALSKFTLSVLIISIILSILSPYVISDADDEALSRASNIISIEASCSEYTFPDLNLIDINNSSILAENISSVLGLGNVSTPIWNEPIIAKDTTMHRLDERLIKGLDYNTWNSIQMAFNFSEGLITLHYDNLDEHNNAFLAFRSILINSSRMAFDSSERRDIGWDIVNSLGISSSSLSVISELEMINDTKVIALPPSDYALYEKNFPSSLRDAYCDRIDLVLSSEFDGMNISGANIIAFSFNNDTGQLIKVEGSLFVDLSSIVTMPVQQALQIGRDKVPEVFSPGTQGNKPDIMIEKDELIGLRCSVVSDEITGNRDVILGYEYAAYVSDSGSNRAWMVLMVIEPESGTVLYSWTIDRGASQGGVFIFNGWLAMEIILPISLLLIGIVIGPPELAFGIFGTIIVPLYMRIRGLRVLENFNRGRIFGYVSSRPGCTFTDLKKELAVLNGELAYHLMVLEKLGLIRSIKDKRNRRYFTSETPPRISISQRLNKMENLILTEISDNDSLSTTEIADALGTSRQRVHYNLKCLKELGIVEDTDKGWRLKTNPRDKESSFDNHNHEHHQGDPSGEVSRKY
jgi:predicted transcriptional regulator